MPQSAGSQRIGSLAADAGVSVDTLRYYEREGLIPPASRTAGGFRLYDQETARRIEFIKQAQQLGLSLREIRQLLRPENDRCSVVRDVIAARLADVDRRLEELTSFRAILKTALDDCDRTLAKSAPCASVQQLRAVTKPGKG